MGVKKEILKFFKMTEKDKKIREVLGFFKGNKGKEIKLILDYMKKRRKIEMINFEGKEEFIKNLNVTSYFDSEKDLYYVLHNGKKIYITRKYYSKKSVEGYYKSLLLEQALNSPHRYLTNSFELEENSCLVDCGGAEGIFTLENIDKIDKAYIFECDSDWLEALKFTFENYKEKVQIIAKYVSDKDSQFEIKLDTFQKEIEEKINFIKIDIEGAEIKALRGAIGILKDNPKLKLAICCYHNQDDEKNILEILKSSYKIEKAKGYILCMFEFTENECKFGIENLKAPYFRKGVIRAEKI